MSKTIVEPSGETSTDIHDPSLVLRVQLRVASSGKPTRRVGRVSLLSCPASVRGRRAETVSKRNKDVTRIKGAPTGMVLGRARRCGAVSCKNFSL
jgi:hypothetical protein